MPVSQAVKTAVKKYNARMTKQFCLRMNLKTDADVIEALNSVPNKQGYIKTLIRKDIDSKKQIKD